MRKREKALKLIEEHSRFYMAIPGTRGNVGKKTLNADTQFYAMFDVGDDNKEQDDEPVLDETKLEDLENEQLHGETQ